MVKRIFAILLALITLCACAFSSALEPAATYPDRYWKLDSKGKTDLPSKYRTMEDSFPEGSDTTPARDGMETLRISGSGQYNPVQFGNMIADIRARTDGTICVFDLRQETHGFAEGQALSLYADNNAGNAGLDTAAVTELELSQLNSLCGTELTLSSSSKKKKTSDSSGDTSDAKTSETDTEEKKSGSGKKHEPGKKKKDSGSTAEQQVLEVSGVMTEQELCANNNVLYVRVACTDHLCPTDENVDEFLAAYRTLPEDAWLHFHCAAGVGRTGLFMMMADILRNPDVSLEDIIERQVLLGANDPRSSSKSEAEESDEKLDQLQRFYDYAHLYGAGQDAPTFAEYSAGLVA